MVKPKIYLYKLNEKEEKAEHPAIHYRINGFDTFHPASSSPCYPSYELEMEDDSWKKIENWKE